MAAIVTPEWTFADRLRKARRESKKSQAEMAEAIGVSKEAVAAWEAGLNKPRDIVAVARSVEDTTNISAAWLLGVSEHIQ